MTETEVRVLAAGELTLPELAATANREHADAERAAHSTVEHAIAAGEALIAARKQCPYGTWERWCRENLDVARAQADLYIKLARFKDFLRVSEVSSIAQARKVLVGAHGESERTGLWQAPIEVVEEARRYAAEGMALATIAEMAGVSRQTVWTWVYPDRAAEQRRIRLERQTEELKRHQELVSAQRDEAIRQAVRKAGEATKEAWAMAERMQDVLAQAQRETEDREARRALSEASVHYRKMRDEIVKALGVTG